VSSVGAVGAQAPRCRGKFNAMPIPRRSPIWAAPGLGSYLPDPPPPKALRSGLGPRLWVPRVRTSVAHGLAPLPPSDCHPGILNCTAQDPADDESRDCEQQNRHVW
jgi:hypothetical protein